MIFDLKKFRVHPWTLSQKIMYRIAACNKRLYLLVIALLFSSILWGQQKQVYFSIDDLPVVSYGMNDTSFQKNITEKLIASFAHNHIPAIGFVNENKFFNGTVRLLLSRVYRVRENFAN